MGYIWHNSMEDSAGKICQIKERQNHTNYYNSFAGSSDNDR